MASSLSELKSTIGPIGNRLHGLPSRQQEAILDRETQSLRQIVIDLVNPARGISVLGFMGGAAMGAFGNITGATTFDWAGYAPARNCNAQIAERDRSDRQAYDMVMKTGRRLINDGSQEITEESCDFSQEIESARDADSLAEAIISFCCCLPALYAGEPALLDRNDVKRVLVEVIKSIVNTNRSVRNRKVEKEFVIDRAQHYCYVRYKFVSSTSINESCCSSTKNVDVEVTFCCFNVHEDEV